VSLPVAADGRLLKGEEQQRGRDERTGAARYGRYDAAA
jgi:hypothetical protein